MLVRDKGNQETVHPVVLANDYLANLITQRLQGRRLPLGFLANGIRIYAREHVTSSVRDGKTLVPHTPSKFLEELPEETVKLCKPDDLFLKLSTQDAIKMLLDGFLDE